MSLERRPDFHELVRRGVIDRRKLSRRLRAEVAEDLARRADDMLRRVRERRDEELPF